MAAEQETWTWFLFANPYASGILGWAGLLLTVVGFGIAIDQLLRVKGAALTAQAAALDLAKVVRGREQLLHLNSALATLENARLRLGNGSREAASVFLDLSATAVISAQELGSDEDAQRFRKLLLGLRRNVERIETMTDPPSQDVGYLTAMKAMREHEVDIKALAAKARYTYEVQEPTT